MRTVEIYFNDLTFKAQKRLLKAFNTSEKDENWDITPIAIIEREEDTCQSTE
ncbi:MAG: hypothetical protein WCQ90_12020 [Deltaproteobacteria bacterium]